VIRHPMIRLLVILLLVLPALEISGLLLAGRLIGGWPTFLLILLTGLIGAVLARREGRKVWAMARQQLSMGQIPGQSILHGICVFIGGILLVTPGFFTDIAGFLLVFPATRPFFVSLLLRFIRKHMEGGTFRIFRL